MEQNQEHLKNLSEIRSIMEKSSRFISLSGLSGIFAGIFALLGAASVYVFLNAYFFQSYYNRGVYLKDSLIYDGDFRKYLTFLLVDGAVVLILAFSSAIFFTTRRAKKNGQHIWDSTAKRLIFSLLLPLVTGGLFCGALLFHGQIYLVAPATLVFYGLALLNAGKYTLNEIKYLGISEIILGLIATLFIGYGLIFWAIGFGILHIVYGTIMYYRYEK